MPPVTNYTEISGVVEDLIDSSLDWENSVGLAAPQIGHRARVFVLKQENVEGEVEVSVHINPRIIQLSATTATEVEGCGSIPDRYFAVERSIAIQACWTSETSASKFAVL